MQLMVTGRHVEITDPLRTHIEKKMQKIKAHFDRIIEVRVVLSVEKYRQFAEITILGNGGIHFHSTEATDDMYVSVDKAVEKIERQLRRRTTKSRQSKRKKAETEAEGVPADRSEASDSQAEETEMVEQYGPYRVTVNDQFPAKPMSVEEAIMQLDASDNEYFAFVNQMTNDVNLVFRRKEGGYGLLRRPF